MSVFHNIKNFEEWNLSESLMRSLVEQSQQGTAGKAESYRSIALKLAEIFSLYGFFFAQKQGVLDPSNWPKMMSEIIKVRDMSSKWDKIMSLSNFLQKKIASPGMAPTQRGEFGFRGQYDYGRETEGLPRATQFLKSASDASLKGFTPEEAGKAMNILDDTLRSVKPFSLSEGLTILEKRNALPSNIDLLRFADSIGAKLLRIYDDMEATKSAFPESGTKIESFLTSTVIPTVETLKRMIQSEIPNVGTQAAEGYMKKLMEFDQKVDSIARTADSYKSEATKNFVPNYASREFEKSAQDIIDKVKEGIEKQGTQNARWKKYGDVFQGTTDINSPEARGDAQAQPEAKKKAIRALRDKKDEEQKNLAKYLAKKYSVK